MHMGMTCENTCENCANAIMTDSGLFDCWCHEMKLPASGSCAQWMAKQGTGQQNNCIDCPFDGQDCVYCKTCPLP